MTIDPINAGSLVHNTQALLYNGCASEGLNQQLQELTRAVVALAARDPKALARDPLFQKQVNRLKQLETTLAKLKRFGGTHRKGWYGEIAKAPRQEYRKLLAAMTTQAQALSRKHPQAAQQEATRRYGAETGDAVRSIVDSGLPFGLMLMVLAAKLAERYEDKIKGVMRQLEQVSKSGGGKGDGVKSLVKGFAGAVAGTVGGPMAGKAVEALAGAVEGASGSSGGQKSETTLKAELQYWNSKYSEVLTLLSNLMKAENQRNIGIARNMV